jgi:hypothetical protein
MKKPKTKRVTAQSIHALALAARVKVDGFNHRSRFSRLNAGQQAAWKAVADHVNSFIRAKDNSDAVTMDALAARDRAEADRDTARAARR